MKKTLVVFSLLFLFAGTVGARAEGKKEMGVGIVGGAYAIQDSVFREIYGETSFFLGGDLSLDLPLVGLPTDVFFNFKYLEDKGKASYTEEEIKLRIISYTFALRYIVNLNRFRLFLGPGVDFLTYRERYPETFPVGSVDGSTVGFHLQAGTYIDLASSLSLKLFFKYNWAETEEGFGRVNLGGTELGIGVIYRFHL